MYEVQYIDQNMSLAHETKIVQFYKVIKFRGINMWEKQCNHVKTALNTLHFATNLIFNLHISIFLCRGLTTREKKFIPSSEIHNQIENCLSTFTLWISNTIYAQAHIFVVKLQWNLYTMAYTIQAFEIQKKTLCWLINANDLN